MTLFDEPKIEKTIELSSNIEIDDTVKETCRRFDLEIPIGGVKEIVNIPTFPTDFNIGLICGSSGSGKTTIARESFGFTEMPSWEKKVSIVSQFGSFDEASNRLGAVGLNSIPSWLKPYEVLSNGEKFRADMARMLCDGAVIDEFTSVVNRETAKSCSMSIEKYIRNNNIKNVVFCSCHEDIIGYLKPDWVYNTDDHEFYNGRYLCRPEININVIPCGRQAWDMFRKYHYLSGALNRTANCYMALLDGKIPVGFVATLPQPCSIHNAYREHRLVVLPDFQGMGIGNKLSELVAKGYVEKGYRYFSKTSNPRAGIHRDNSPLWRGTLHNHEARRDYINKDGTTRQTRYTMKDEKYKKMANRICYCHEYIGENNESFNSL